MPQPPNDPVLIGFAVGTLLLSIATGLYLLFVRKHHSVLDYESRNPVPWNAAATLLAVLAIATVIAALILKSPDDAKRKTTAADRAELLLVETGSQVLTVGVFVFVVALLCGANQRDLGMPTDSATTSRDVRIGLVAGMAALAPVIFVQSAFTYLIYGHDKESGHPLIKLVTSGPPSEIVMLLMGVAVVVVAPICEEFTFRVLFQGWLEKWEDKRLGWRREVTAAQVMSDQAPTTTEVESQPESWLVESDSRSIERTPPRQGVGGLPYGWFPILVSATTFGFVHAGYGPEPVPLFLLGLVLGYLYQRTHRVIPGIVAHALFNLFSVIMLWRMMYHPS